MVIVDNTGFIEAPGLAELLALQGKDVEIVTRYSMVGTKLVPYNEIEYVYPRIIKAGVKLTPFTWVKEIGNGNITLYNIFTNDERVEQVDDVILITGSLQNDGLDKSLRGRVPEIHIVGDCRLAGGKIDGAIADGNRVGRII